MLRLGFLMGFLSGYSPCLHHCDVGDSSDSSLGNASVTCAVCGWRVAAFFVWSMYCLVLPQQKTSIICWCLLWEKNRLLGLLLLLPFVLT